jgi:intracellular protein transport protein USO1
MVKGNPGIQTSFAGLQVNPLVEHDKLEQPNGHTNGVKKVYIIEALLDVVIAAPIATPFEVRMAACECIKAYYHKHTIIRHHFLNRAIEGHMAGEDETANVLSTLLREDLKTGDPYRVWFAADLVFHLVWEDPEAKSLLMKVSEGDASNGEEVITCIQSIAEILISGIQKEEDERVLIGYFTVLCGWLFEDAAAVNDFLGEGSNVQVLKQTMAASGHDNVILNGLSAVLLGIIYEYSTKDSPIPRRKLQPILTAHLGRERYLQALTQLRQHPLVRDYEVVPQGASSAPAGHDLPPYAFFDSTFIDFLKDNFSRLSRAIDRDPGIEAQIPSREEGIDRDLVDSLRAQLDDKVQTLQKLETDRLNLERRLDHDQATHRKEQETSSAEVNRIKQINEALQKNHALETQKLEQNHATAYQSLQASTSQEIQDLQKQIENIQKVASDEAARTKEYFERTINQLRNAKTGLDNRFAEAMRNIESSGQELVKAQQALKQSHGELQSTQKKMIQLEEDLKERDQQISELRSAGTQLKESLEDEKTKVTMLEKEVSDLDVVLKVHREKFKTVEEALSEKEEARSAAQTELDDLMMILGDLEEKRTRDKVSMRWLLIAEGKSLTQSYRNV